MPTLPTQSSHETLRSLLCTEVFLSARDTPLPSMGDDYWIFDFRRVLMRSEVISLLVEEFISTVDTSKPFQLCSLEIAGVPMVASFAYQLERVLNRPVNAFFIRKSSKLDYKDRIEGVIQQAVPIIVLDDIINTGSSLQHQLDILTELNYTVHTAWFVLSFRDADYYQAYADQGITIMYPFDLNDLKGSPTEIPTNIQRIPQQKTPHPKLPYHVCWSVEVQTPRFLHITPQLSHTGTALQVGTGDSIINLDDTTGDLIGKKHYLNILPPLTTAYSLETSQHTLYLSPRGRLSLVRRKDKLPVSFFNSKRITHPPLITALSTEILLIASSRGVLTKQYELSAFDIQKNTVQWQINSPDSSPFTRVICEQDHCIALTKENTLLVIDIPSGSILTQTSLLLSLPCTRLCIYPDTNGVFLVDTAGCVHTYNFQNNILRTIHTPQIPQKTDCLIHGKHLIIISPLDKHVTALKTENNSVVWQTRNDNTRIGSFCWDTKDTLYLGTNGGRLYAIDLNNGNSTILFYGTKRLSASLCVDKQKNIYALAEGNMLSQISPK